MESSSQDLPPVPPPTDDAPLPAPPTDLPVPPTDDAPLPTPPAEGLGACSIHRRDETYPWDPPVPPAAQPVHQPIVRRDPPKWLLPAAGVLLVAGCGLSAFLHFQTASLNENIAEQEKQAALLQKEIDTLTEQIAEAEKQKALSAEEKAKQLATLQDVTKRLEELLPAVQKENTKLSQQYATLSKNAENIKADIAQKTKAIIDLTQGNTPSTDHVNATTVSIPTYTPLFTQNEETDKMLREKVISYMKARKSGNIDTISALCASECYHLGSDQKELGHTEYMGKLKSEWQKYPNRSYRLLKVAYSGSAIEFVYWYSYTGKKGVSARGYAKERWDYNAGEKKIFYQQEVLSDKGEPSISENLRLINLK